MTDPPLLERQLRELLQGLPLRRAPSRLVDGVLARVAAPRRVRWWRRRVIDWPAPARIAFVMLGVGLGSVTVLVGAWAAGRVPHLVAASEPVPLAWAAPVWGLLKAWLDVAALLPQALPPNWLEAGLLLAAALYAWIVALSAAAYRLLYQRST